MVLYLAKALLPSTWPDILPTMFGSDACLYALATKVLRAMWLLAISFIGRSSISPVFGLRTSTLRIIPAMVNQHLCIS